MRRILVVLLTAVTVFASVGCAQHLSRDESATFYYKRAHLSFNAAESVITYELRDVQGLRGNNTDILNVYLDGPKASELINVFPEKCEVLLLSVSEEVASIYLSRTFGELKGAQLTVACVCLARTVMELTGAKTVRISAKDVPLAGEQYLEFDEENVLFYDDNEALAMP